MSIKVICPGCHSEFKVSDRFAGKAGSCPKCKATIQVPQKGLEVKIYDPTLSRLGTDARTTLRPILRPGIKFAPSVAIGLLVATVVVFLGAWMAGETLQRYWLVRTVGLLLISPPLALAGYLLLHDDEHLDLFVGRSLMVRTAICSVAYAVLWGVFGYVSGYALTGEAWCWLIIAPPFVIMGALTSLACYDFDFSTGCLHYGFYLIITILLRGCAGMGWIWEIGRLQ